MEADLWSNDLIQFARLLTEIQATQQIDMDTLRQSMDLEDGEIDELFYRAEQRFENIKSELQRK